MYSAKRVAVRFIKIKAGGVVNGNYSERRQCALVPESIRRGWAAEIHCKNIAENATSNNNNKFLSAFSDGAEGLG